MSIKIESSFHHYLLFLPTRWSESWSFTTRFSWQSRVYHQMELIILVPFFIIFSIAITDQNRLWLHLEYISRIIVDCTNYSALISSQLIPLLITPIFISYDELIDTYTMQLIHHPLSVLHSLLVDVVPGRLFHIITSELTITGSMTKYIHNHKVELIKVQLILEIS